MSAAEVVVDASIIVKWFVEEEGSDKSLKLRDRYIEGEIRIIAPELMIFETLNALYYNRLFSGEESIRNTQMHTTDEKLMRKLKHGYQKYVKSIKDF